MKKLKIRDGILIGSAIAVFLICWRVLSSLIGAAETVGDTTPAKNSEFHIFKIALIITIGYCIIYYVLYGIFSIVKNFYKSNS